MLRSPALALALAATLALAPACGDDGGVAGETGSADDTPDDPDPSDDTPDTADEPDDTGAEPPDPRADFAWPVDEAGPYEVGYRQVEVVYEPPVGPSPRTLQVGLWYPTEDTSGDEVAYFGIFFHEGVHSGASLAPPAVGDTYPVHLHSHGHQGYAGSSPHLMAHFASHGWVVAAPDHTFNTIIDFLDPRPTWVYAVRGHDLTATLDALADLPAADPLSGTLHLDAVVGSGHSFGGYTIYGTAGASYDMATIEAGCAVDEGPGGACTEAEIAAFAAGVRDERVVAAMPLAAGNRELYGDAGFETLAVPILKMTGDHDDRVTNEAQGDPTWAALLGPAIRVDVLGGCHHLFALGGCDLIDDVDGLPIVNAYTLAFARHHLLGDASVTELVTGVEAYGGEHVVVSTKLP